MGKHSKANARGGKLGRRKFIKLGAAAGAMTITGLSAAGAPAQASDTGAPWSLIHERFSIRGVSYLPFAEVVLD